MSNSFMDALISNIVVSSREGFVYIEGVNPDVIKRDIGKLMNKSTIGNLIIEIVGERIIKIPEFFVLEFFLLLKLLKSNRKNLCDERVTDKLLDVLKKNTWLADTDKNFPSKMDYKNMDNFKVSLFPFQRTFLEKFDQTTQKYHLNGLLLAGAAGSGKTLTSLVTMDCLNMNKVVIVCPKNAIYKVWEDNIVRFFKKPQTYWIAADGKSYKDERFIIMHYEAMERVIQWISSIKKEDSSIGIILDESHNLNEIKTKRTEEFIELCKLTGSKNIIFASGTPIKALAVEALPMFSVLDNFFNPHVAEIFRKLYMKNMDIVKELMRRRLNEVVYKIEKSQLGLDEPVFNYIAIKPKDAEKYTLESIKKKVKEYILDTSKQYLKDMSSYIKEFNALVDESEKNIQKDFKNNKDIPDMFTVYRQRIDFIRDQHNKGSLKVCKNEISECLKFEKAMIIPGLKDKDKKQRFKDIRTIVKYFKLKIIGDVIGKIILKARVDANIEIAKSLDYNTILNSTKKKTVFFTSYIQVAEAAMEATKNLGRSPIGVYGEYVANLKNIVTQFESDVKINPLIATYASLSTAVPLITADTMICCNVPFRNYILEQAISRIHRLGADTQCCINIVTLDTGKYANITTRTVDILRWSQEEVQKIVGLEIPYKIEDVMSYKDTDSMAPIIHTGVSELALKPDALADKFIANMKKIKPGMVLREW